MEKLELLKDLEKLELLKDLVKLELLKGLEKGQGSEREKPEPYWDLDFVQYLQMEKVTDLGKVKFLRLGRGLVPALAKVKVTPLVKAIAEYLDLEKLELLKGLEIEHHLDLD